MITSEVSNRYASALFQLAKDSGKQDQIFNELRALKEMFSKNNEARAILSLPTIKGTDKVKAFVEALKTAPVSEEVKAFCFLLAKKNRLPIFFEVVDAYQSQIDISNGVTRGVVRSTTVLSPEERQRIEKIVSQVTKKQVIMSYKQDTALIGGLIAEVGSYTFDDTLTTHLKRLKEELKRSAH